MASLVLTNSSQLTSDSQHLAVATCNRTRSPVDLFSTTLVLTHRTVSGVCRRWCRSCRGDSVPGSSDLDNRHDAARPIQAVTYIAVVPWKQLVLTVALLRSSFSTDITLPLALVIGTEEPALGCGGYDGEARVRIPVGCGRCESHVTPSPDVTARTRCHQSNAPSCYHSC
uniref:Uncharacterized protein n=1 Tax=Timema shepardi TaxID=629360 RepID=A0A7R9FYS5_TIMSH|nr:unnamed protein product [Timema shepardi]